MKRATEECISWDINDLSRAGVFKAPPLTSCDCTWKDAAGNETYRANFRWEDNPRASRLRILEKRGKILALASIIELASVPCHFGGMKRLFKCPGDRIGNLCGQRVQKLYLVDGRWKCRRCGKLTYVARRTHDKRRDALMRDLDSMLELLRSDDHKKRLLAVGACAQAIARSVKRGEITP
jgi:hypothetical protein